MCSSTDLRHVLWGTLLVVLLVVTVPLSGTWWTLVMLPGWFVVGITAADVWGWAGRARD